MKSIKVKIIKEKREKTKNELVIYRNESNYIELNSSSLLTKGDSLCEIDVRQCSDEYSMNIQTTMYYDIDTFEMYTFTGSKVVETYEKVYQYLLDKWDWHPEEIDKWNKALEIATEITRIEQGEFVYELIFDDLQEMLDFIKYYDTLDYESNILDNYKYLINN